MEDAAKLALGIRTIVATTRVAVKSNQAAGRDDLALGSARRGEALLGDLASRIPPDASPDVWKSYREARERLAVIVEEAAQRAISVGDGQGSLDEHIDVRAELGSKLS